MEYRHKEIETRWQAYWKENETYKVSNESDKPKYYVLDMFPYPSGAGLHVGHPLGYIASDIYARFKTHKGFNVLHPMGFDSFGLPTEQFAIQTGQHPALTTEINVERYRKQLDKIGFSFDWNREVRTSEPSYYHWTQWIFKQLFDSYYDYELKKAMPIKELVKRFEAENTRDWNNISEAERYGILMSDYRLAYLTETTVNWCADLGTVLANDEVINGLSERGGFPVEKKKMLGWQMRITAYAERLLEGLDGIDWSESIKEAQRYWIGRSEGAGVWFKIAGSDEKFEVFTTRPDTIFGVSFVTLAPEHPLVLKITAKEQKQAVEKYIEQTGKRSERERLADAKTITGQFTGAYAEHPLTGEKVPVYISDYVLAGYGTGAVMAVPAGDERDYGFAKHFNLPVIPIVEGKDISEGACTEKNGIYLHSFIKGLDYEKAVRAVITELERKEAGRGMVNFRMRDAVFSRQRYWGEPVPVHYVGGRAEILPDAELPVVLPEVDKYLPTEHGEPPLGRAKNFASKAGYPMELNTMPGWAGSSWYFLRYMSPDYDKAFADPKAVDYWKDVDLYVGGTEHATGHLLYARFWNKFLYDRGLVPSDEPFRKLINQGMILGTSAFVYRINGTNTFVSYGLKDEYGTTALHVDVSLVENGTLNVEGFKKWREEFKSAEFILENGKYICGSEVEKMSKSKFNVVNPDDIVELYGADTLRLYEMFLGPVEQSKPWKTEGITGVYNFLKKLCRLYENVSHEEPSKQELKTLHKTIKKLNEDIENFSLNTSVSAMMIAVNELSAAKCSKKAILEPLSVLVSPFAPHVAEELFHSLGNTGSVTKQPYPQHDERYLAENSFDYPVMIGGKLRFKADFSLALSAGEVEEQIKKDERLLNYTGGKAIKRIIVVAGKIINVVS